MLYLAIVSLFLQDAAAWQIRSHRGPLQKERNFLTKGFIEERFNVIFPGTKWCGSGSIAQDTNDLGVLETTDVCCRDHDRCDDVIEAGQSSHGLTNNALYTRVACVCDEKFLDCLHMEAAQSSKAAYLIGLIYFDALNTQCFREDYPIIGCNSYFSYTRRCKEYEFNTTADKEYQWFDVPLF